MTIDENLLGDIIGYCELNDIDHVKWVNDTLKENLMLLKYQQYYPSDKQQSEKQINKSNQTLPKDKKVNNKNNSDFYGE